MITEFLSYSINSYFFVLLSPFHISRIILYIFFFLYSHVVASIFWVKIKAKRQWLITGIDPFSLIFYDCFLKTFYKLCFLRLIFIKLNEYRDIIIQRLINLFILTTISLFIGFIHHRLHKGRIFDYNVYRKYPTSIYFIL